MIDLGFSLSDLLNDVHTLQPKVTAHLSVGRRPQVEAGRSAEPHAYVAAMAAILFEQETEDELQ
jgi:hypothetical protein